MLAQFWFSVKMLVRTAKLLTNYIMFDTDAIEGKTDCKAN